MGIIIKLNSFLFFSYSVIILLEDGSTRKLDNKEKIQECIDKKGKRFYRYDGKRIINFQKF